MRGPAFCLFFLFCFTAYGQFDTRQVWHDGEIRTYVVHVPDSWDGEQSLPLVINMHGFGSNTIEQLAYTRFNVIANQQNFMVVYPQGLEATIPIGTGAHWNAGFLTEVDDIGFISKLIDVLWNEYRVDLSRVYATGMSNGGFMAYTLGCELSGRIAAIASVTGAMTIVQEENCAGEYVVPVLQFHGTEDEVVPYEGSQYFMSVPELMDFWALRHGCSTETFAEDLDDVRTGDESTVTRITYENCESVILYRINNGGHTWPDGAIDQPSLGATNRDINATSLIWEFFSGIQHPGPEAARVITSIEPVSRKGHVFPTIFESHLILKDYQGATATIVDQSGRTWKNTIVNSDLLTWNVSSLVSGIYLVKLEFADRRPEVIKVIKL